MNEPVTDLNEVTLRGRLAGSIQRRDGVDGDSFLFAVVVARLAVGPDRPGGDLFTVRAPASEETAHTLAALRPGDAIEVHGALRPAWRAGQRAAPRIEVVANLVAAVPTPKEHT